MKYNDIDWALVQTHYDNGLTLAQVSKELDIPLTAYPVNSGSTTTGVPGAIRE